MSETGGADRRRWTMTPASAPSWAEERSLHERLMARDAQALATIYASSSPSVYAQALQVTGDRATAEDITQAVFLDLWLRPERYQPEGGPLRPWLATVAHHAGVDWVRRRANLLSREVRFSQVTLASGPDQEETLDGVLVAEKVLAALDALPEQQSIPIRLAFFHGMSYRHVAKELAVPEATAKARIRLGLHRIHTALRIEDGGGYAGQRRDQPVSSAP